MIRCVQIIRVTPLCFKIITKTHFRKFAALILCKIYKIKRTALFGPVRSNLIKGTQGVTVSQRKCDPVSSGDAFSGIFSEKKTVLFGNLNIVFLPEKIYVCRRTVTRDHLLIVHIPFQQLYIVKPGNSPLKHLYFSTSVLRSIGQSS